MSRGRRLRDGGDGWLLDLLWLGRKRGGDRLLKSFQWWDICRNRLVILFGVFSLDFDIELFEGLELDEEGVSDGAEFAVEHVDELIEDATGIVGQIGRTHGLF